MTALSDRLNEAKGDDGLDVVVARAEAKGHQVHRATFASYFKGKHAKRPSEDVLQALADGLSLKITELREIAGMPAGELGEYKPTPLANRLNRDQRAALDELIRTIVTAKEGTDSGTSAEKIEREGGLPVYDAEAIHVATQQRAEGTSTES
jgi:hypothetical protein